MVTYAWKRVGLPVDNDWKLVTALTDKTPLDLMHKVQEHVNETYAIVHTLQITKQEFLKYRKLLELV